MDDLEKDEWMNELIEALYENRWNTFSYLFLGFLENHVNNLENDYENDTIRQYIIDTFEIVKIAANELVERFGSGEIETERYDLYMVSIKELVDSMYEIVQESNMDPTDKNALTQQLDIRFETT